MLQVTTLQAKGCRKPRAGLEGRGGAGRGRAFFCQSECCGGRFALRIGSGALSLFYASFLQPGEIRLKG